MSDDEKFTKSDVDFKFTMSDHLGRSAFDSSFAYHAYLDRKQNEMDELMGRNSRSGEAAPTPLSPEEFRAIAAGVTVFGVAILGMFAVDGLFRDQRKRQEEHNKTIYIPHSHKVANKDFLEHEGIIQDIARVEQKKKTTTPLILKLESEDKGLFVFLPPGNTATEFNKIVVCHQMRAEKSTGPSKNVTETFAGIMHFTPADGFTQKAIYEETSPTYAVHSYDMYKYGKIQMTACPTKLYKLAQSADNTSIMIRELNAETYFGTGLRGKINHLINKF